MRSDQVEWLSRHFEFLCFGSMVVWKCRSVEEWLGFVTWLPHQHQL